MSLLDQIRNYVTSSARNVYENVRELPTGIGTILAQPTINRIQREIDLTNEEQRQHILKRARQQVDPVKRQKLFRLAQGVESPNVQYEVNPRLREADYAKRIGGTFFDVATLPVGAVQGLTKKAAFKGLTAGQKLLAYGGLRGAEAGLYGAGRDIATGEGIGTAIRNLPRNVAAGAVLNTALSPRLVGKTLRELPQNIRNINANQVPGFSRGFAKVPGGDPFSIPENLKNDLTVNYGKDFDKITAKELRESLARTKAEITDNGALLSKIGNPNKGIDTGVFETRESLKFGGYNKGIFTDGYILVNDKKISDGILDGILDKEAAAGARDLVKKGKASSYEEAYKNIRQNLDKMKNQKDLAFPTDELIKSITPLPTDGSRAKVAGHFSESGNIRTALTDGKINIAVDTDKLAFMKKQFPNADIRINGDTRAVTFVERGKVRGLVMPIKSERVASMKFNVPASTPPVVALKVAAKEFDDTWKRAYGNRPQTVATETALDRANKVRKTEPTLTMDEARKVARMSDKELADYNRAVSDPLDSLKNEARKYKSAEEFVKAHQAKDLLDLSNPEKHRLGRIFEDGVNEDTGKYMDTLATVKQYGEDLRYTPEAKVPNVKSPNDMVTIYRGTRKGQKEMLPGDFVSFSKEYALSHNEGEKLLTLKVPAKDVVWQGNDFNEWVYSPENMRGGNTYKGGLTDLYNEATRPTIAGKKLVKEVAPKETAVIPTPINQEKPRINLNRIKVSKNAKQEIANAVEDIKPKLEETVGRKLSLEEVKIAAGNVSGELRKGMTRQEAEQMGAKALALRQKIAKLSEETAKTGRATPELLEALETDISYAAGIARLLGQRRIDAEPIAKGIAEQYIRAVVKAGVDLEDIKKAAQTVDFNNPDEATTFYRNFVKPTLTEWLDVVRYNSMLSSPLTHIVNITSNIAGMPVRLATKVATGAVDWIGSKATGKKQGQFAGEGLAYAKGYLGEAKTAWNKMVRVMKGLDLPELDDFRESNIPLATEGRLGSTYNVLSAPMKLLEGMDQFFMALGRAGEGEVLKYRGSKGGVIPKSLSGQSEAIERAAKYTVFRTKLGDEAQGTFLKAIDEVGNMVSRARQSDNKVTSTIAKYTFPFLQTPTNIFKQGIEYSPLGFATIPGAANKTEQLTKALMGSAVFASAAAMLTSDRLTFGLPSSEKERNLWKEAGKQEYSIKVGDKWIAYNKMHPAIAFPFAFVAGIQDAVDRRKITDSDVEVALSSLSKTFSFLFDQSYMKSMGAFLDTAQGVSGTLPQIVSNYGQQLIPFRAFGGWFARALDEYQRTTEPGAKFWDKQMQLLMMQIPGLRGFTPTRVDEQGVPIKAPSPMLNAVSPLRVSPARKDAEERLQQYKIEQKERRDIEALREQARNQLKAETMTGGVQAAETALPERKGAITTQEGELLPGVRQRGGLYAYTVDGEIKITKDRDKANLETAKEQLRNSDSIILEYNDKVLRKNKDGEVSTMSKDQYDYSLNTNKMQLAKKKEDYKGWVGLAEKQLNIIAKALEDPTLDELEKSDLEEKAINLLEQAKKYKSYGGFKKPKKGKKKTIRLTNLSKGSVSRGASLPKFSAPKLTTGKIGIKLARPKLSVSRPAGARLRAVRGRGIKIVK